MGDYATASNQRLILTETQEINENINNLNTILTSIYYVEIIICFALILTITIKIVEKVLGVN